MMPGRIHDGKAVRFESAGAGNGGCALADRLSDPEQRNRHGCRRFSGQIWSRRAKNGYEISQGKRSPPLRSGSGSLQSAPASSAPRVEVTGSAAARPPTAPFSASSLYVIARFRHRAESSGSLVLTAKARRVSAWRR
jgi:hypothetical protein